MAVCPFAIHFTRTYDPPVLVGDPAQDHAKGVETKTCALGTLVKPVVMVAGRGSW